jgi:CRISPR-associated protein Cas2
MAFQARASVGCFLVAYDIADDNRRSHIAQILLDYGQRVQESVFCLEIDDEVHERLLKRLRKAMDDQGDVVWVVPTCRNCRKSVLTFGRTTVPVQPKFYVI